MIWIGSLYNFSYIPILYRWKTKLEESTCRATLEVAPNLENLGPKNHPKYSIAI
jgi:hypothetical protein